jgi:hypothetical protein
MKTWREEWTHEHETRTPPDFNAWLQNRVPRCIEVIKVEGGLMMHYDNGSSRFHAVPVGET